MARLRIDIDTSVLGGCENPTTKNRLTGACTRRSPAADAPRPRVMRPRWRPHGFIHMRLLRATAASSLLFVLAVAWNGVLHLVILQQANEPLRRLQRTDLAHPIAVSLALTALVCILFVWGYSHFARTGTLREGLAYGLVMGLFAAVLVDLNQYLLYPLPFTLVLKWFVGGVLEFALYGAVISRFFPLRRAGARA